MAISFLSGQSIDGNVTIATSGVTDNLILTSTDTSAASAPDIVLYRNAAIADSDTLGVVEYKGKNGMVPSSGTPLTYNAIYSRIADASNNQSIITLSAHKGNGSGSFIHAVNISAIGTNNSATGAILINPLTDFSLPAYNLDVNGTAYISNTLLINGELSLDNIANASTDTDKFVVADNGVIKYRTGSQVRSDIGAGTGSGTVTSVATGNGISGGTITSTGTLTVGAGNGLSQSSTGLLMSGSYTGNFSATGDITADQFISTNNGNGQNYKIGDDVWIGDINVANTMRISGNQNPNNGYITFGNSSNTALGRAGTGALTWGGDFQTTGDITVSGGDITLGGTGRIQGIDTVSAGTDATNKSYVDTAVAGAGSGTFLPLAGGTMTGLVTDLELANDLVTGKTGAGNIYAKDSGNTFWQVFKSGSATYMTTAGTSSDSIYLGAPTTSVTTNLVASGNIQTGNTGDGSLSLKQSGTMFMQMFSQYSGSFINTGTSGGTIHFGNTSGLVCNVNVAGFLDADNFKINGAQGTNGQVLTSSGSGVSWQTPTSGTVTGSGASNKLAVWTTGANIVNTKITDNSGFYALDNYTATAVSTTGPIDPNQNAQAASQDTLATLSVDPTGNIVRGEQEATFTFTLAQLNTTLGQTLISAPGAGKAVVITYTDWMMKYSSTGSVNNQLEIRQANLAQANASVSVLPALRFNEIVNQSQSGSAPFYGFYTRDIPTGSGSQGRTYAVNKPTTFHKQTSSPYPSGLTSISIKIRYRIFDVSTF